MGCYVNPPTMSKEDWLEQNGERTRSPCELTDTHLPVCLVNNGIFNAAGVAFSARELEAFNQPSDHRPKTWYRVAIDKLHTVSDLHNYLR